MHDLELKKKELTSKKNEQLTKSVLNYQETLRMKQKLHELRQQDKLDSEQKIKSNLQLDLTKN
jgi:hypothetical protein